MSAILLFKEKMSWETQMAKINGFLTVLSFLGIPLFQLQCSRNHSGDLCVAWLPPGFSQFISVGILYILGLWYDFIFKKESCLKKTKNKKNL